MNNLLVSKLQSQNQKAKGKRQKAIVVSQKSLVVSRKLKGDSQKLKGDSQKALVVSRKSIVDSQKLFSIFYSLFSIFFPLSSFLFPLFSILYFLFTPNLSYSQVKDSVKVNQLDEVLVSATRVTTKMPLPFSDFSKKEIEKRNLGQDIPVLLNFLPSVVTTSDAGNGFGYTGIRVRGSDATRVNVTINGIPYNDSESSSTYFVDMPDFASSLQSIQLQRGVGTSTNGNAAFGASLNLLTQEIQQQASGEIANSFGSFNSRKNTVKFSTGLLNNHFEIAGRLSVLHSDGYVDRAFSDLKSYFLQGTYVGKTTLIKALAFGGTEKTYQAWYGVDAETLANNRTYNFAGMYTDANGTIQFYDNQTDNYQQDQYQWHWNEKISEKWNTNVAFHYTKGKGYYEEYQAEQDLAIYGLTPFSINGTTLDKTDLISQKWLDNDFYGATFSGNYKTKNLDFIIGGSLNKYEGKHFGTVIWAQNAFQLIPNLHYYDNFATKTDGNFFAKATCQLTEKFSLFGDVQFRNVHYKFESPEAGLINDSFTFFNPKTGINFELTKKNSFYFSYAKAHREPNRTDYENGNPKPESLDDFELGWRFSTSKTQINWNGYYMLYHDQLVLTGALDAVGNPIRTNIGKSYRMGMEVDANILIHKKWRIAPNFTLSENKNIDFIDNSSSVLVNKGNTTIAFSPKFIAGNTLTFNPISGLQFHLLSKFVSEQFLSNSEDWNSKLQDYFVQDCNAVYEIQTKKVFKSITFTALVNNVFDKKYVSNGADYSGGYVYYFPQAGTHFLMGMSLRF